MSRWLKLGSARLGNASGMNASFLFTSLVFVLFIPISNLASLSEDHPIDDHMRYLTPHTPFPVYISEFNMHMQFNGNKLT